MMMFRETRNDVGPLYVDKLFVERCVLAMAKVQAGDSLSETDRECMIELARRLSHVEEAQKAPRVSSLMASESGTVHTIVEPLLGARLISTVLELSVYVEKIRKAVNNVVNGRKLRDTERKQLLQFLDIISNGISHHIELNTEREYVGRL